MQLDRRTLLQLGAAGLAAAAAPGAEASGPADWALAVRSLSGDVAPRPLSLVSGRVPAGLEGTLYRNGPAQFARGDTLAHWFDGDGLVRAFRIGPSGATLAARFVDTPKRRAEAAADRMIVGGFAPGAPNAVIRGTGDANAANTSVLAVKDRLWALWEGGSPIEVDPATLRTLGPVSFRDDLREVPFLAHPRRAQDGTVWNLGLAGDRGVIWRLAPDGVLLSATPLRLPRSSYVHDFTITDRDVVILLQPWLRERDGEALTDSLVWRPEAGSQVLVLDMDDLSRRRIYELPPLFFFHLGDGWREADGSIVFDGCFRRDDRHAVRDIGRMTRGTPFVAAPMTSALVRLGPGDRATVEWTSTVAEFPGSDGRYAGRRRRFSWHTTGDERPLSRGLAVRDWRSGRLRTCDLGGGHVMEEAVFAARPGGSEEGDGWLIAPSINLRERVTELHVFDARHLDAGPLCTWRADIALPSSFHGAFVSSA